MKSLHALLLVVIYTTLFHLGSADHAISCEDDVIFVQDDRSDQIPNYNSYGNLTNGGELAVTCKNNVIYVAHIYDTSIIPYGSRRIIIRPNYNSPLNVHIVTCKDDELNHANLATGKLEISEMIDSDARVFWCENNVHYIQNKGTGEIEGERRRRREANIGVHTIPKPCNIIRGVSADQVAIDVSGHTMNKLHCVNVGNTAKAIMIGSERFESLSCDNSGWKGKPIGEGKDLVDIIDDNFILTMSCADYSGNEPTDITPLSPPVTTVLPTMPPTIPTAPTMEVPTTTTTKAVEQTTPYPIDYARAHQLISCKQDIIFVQDTSGLQVSTPVKSVYLGGKVAVTCKNDVIFVVQPCGSARTIPSVNANGEAVKVLLNANTNEELTSIHIITCKDNEMYAANLTSDELQIHEKFDFDNMTIWCEKNVHYIEDKRTGKIVGDKRGRREAKIGVQSSASEVTGDVINEGRRE